MLLVDFVLLLASELTVSLIGIIRGMDDGHERERPFPRFLDRTA
jgi:hypothetical protein